MIRQSVFYIGKYICQATLHAQENQDDDSKEFGTPGSSIFSIHFMYSMCIILSAQGRCLTQPLKMYLHVSIWCYYCGCKIKMSLCNNNEIHQMTEQMNCCYCKFSVILFASFPHSNKKKEPNKQPSNTRLLIEMDQVPLHSAVPFLHLKKLLGEAISSQV